MNQTTAFGTGIPEEQIDSEVSSFREQFEGRNLLDVVVRRGAQQILQQAIEAEVQEFLQQQRDRRDAGAGALQISGKVRRRLRMSPQGSRGIANVLRLPGGALDPPADDQPDRIDLCDDPATPSPDQGQRHTESEPDDDVQARPSRSEEMAAPAWLGTSDAYSARKDFRGWSVTGRRLVQPAWNTTFRSEERRVGKECRSRWSPYH